MLLIINPGLIYVALPYCECGNSMTRLIPGIFDLILPSSLCVSWTHNTSHFCDSQWVIRSSPLVTKKPSIFCVITLIAGGVGHEKFLFDVECLGNLALVLVRLIRNIFIFCIESYIVM